MSNILDRLKLVLTAFRYAPNSRLSLAEKEAMATTTYVSLSRFYNELPGFLKLPGSSKEPRPAHIYSLQ